METVNLLAERSACTERKGRIGPKLVAALTMWALFAACTVAADPTGPLPDWETIASLSPKLKVLVLMEADRPFSLRDLALLADLGLKPADRDPGLALGLTRLVFTTTIRQWMEGPPLPSHLHGTLLRRFTMRGIYRCAFRVESGEYQGPLSIEVTMPRDGFGRRLLSREYVVRPECKLSTRKDSAGNSWLKASLPFVQHGDTIKFHFAFEYLVDMADLLDHALDLAQPSLDTDLPPEVKPFLSGGYKIDPTMREAVAWAKRGRPGPLNAKEEFARLTETLKRSVTYDQRKRNEYFSGRSVYYDLDVMYQPASVTLSRRMGCCPDTILLECAFLRARGIPCRTAGRFGHFFSMVYVPGSGWKSTSVTPTGIPLILSPGPDHVPYQNWSPRIPLRTTRWEARVRIQPVEEP